MSIISSNDLKDSFDKWVIRKDLVSFVNSINGIKSCQLGVDEKCYDGYCKDCYGDDVRKCGGCGKNFMLNELIIIKDDYYSLNCYNCLE